MLSPRGRGRPGARARSGRRSCSARRRTACSSPRRYSARCFRSCPIASLDEAIAFVAARERPLALYCFSNSRREREQVLDGAISGGVDPQRHPAPRRPGAPPLRRRRRRAASAPITATKASSASATPGRCTRIGFVNVFEKLGPALGEDGEGAGAEAGEAAVEAIPPSHFGEGDRAKRGGGVLVSAVAEQ